MTNMNDVKVIYEDTALSCFTSLCAFYRVNPAPEYIQQNATASSAKLGLEKLIAIAKASGFEAALVRLDWRSLLLEASKCPVLLLLENGNVVVAMEKGRRGREEIVVSDPLYQNGENCFLPRESLESAWTGNVLILQPRKPKTERFFSRALFGFLVCLIVAGSSFVIAGVLRVPLIESRVTDASARVERQMPTADQASEEGVINRDTAPGTAPVIDGSDPQINAASRQSSINSTDRPLKPDKEDQTSIRTIASPIEKEGSRPARPEDAFPEVAQRNSQSAETADGIEPALTMPDEKSAGGASDESQLSSGIPGRPSTKPMPAMVSKLEHPARAATDEPPSAGQLDVLEPTSSNLVSQSEPSHAFLPNTEQPTAVDTATASPSNLPSADPQPSNINAADLVKRGDSLLARGDITTARLFYERAANAQDVQAAFRLAESYDPEFLARARIAGARGDAALAIKWYLRALELGASGAPVRLKEFSSQD